MSTDTLHERLYHLVADQDWAAALALLPNLSRNEACFRDAIGRNALSYALLSPDRGAAQLALILLDEFPDMVDIPGMMDLQIHFAAQGGQIQAVQNMVTLLRKQERGHALQTSNAEGCTPLIMAAQQAHHPVVDYLLQQPEVQPLTFNDQHRHALWFAAHEGCLRSVQRLLPFGGLNHADDDGMSPLFTAAQHGHLDVVDALLNAGAQPWLTAVDGDGNETFFGALHALALCDAQQVGYQEDNLRAVAQRLAQVVDPLARDHHGDTALMRAMENFNVAATEALLPVSGHLSLHQNHDHQDLLDLTWPQNRPEDLEVLENELGVLNLLVLHIDPTDVLVKVREHAWPEAQVARLLPVWFRRHEAATLQAQAQHMVLEGATDPGHDSEVDPTINAVRYARARI